MRDSNRSSKGKKWVMRADSGSFIEMILRRDGINSLTFEVTEAEGYNVSANICESAKTEYATLMREMHEDMEREAQNGVQAHSAINCIFEIHQDTPQLAVYFQYRVNDIGINEVGLRMVI